MARLHGISIHTPTDTVLISRAHSLLTQDKLLLLMFIFVVQTSILCWLIIHWLILLINSCSFNLESSPIPPDASHPACLNVSSYIYIQFKTDFQFFFLGGLRSYNLSACTHFHLTILKRSAEHQVCSITLAKHQFIPLLASSISGDQKKVKHKFKTSKKEYIEDSIPRTHLVPGWCA